MQQSEGHRSRCDNRMGRITQLCELDACQARLVQCLLGLPRQSRALLTSRSILFSSCLKRCDSRACQRGDLPMNNAFDVALDINGGTNCFENPKGNINRLHSIATCFPSYPSLLAICPPLLLLRLPHCQT
jgi:hypothetical protein